MTSEEELRFFYLVKEICVRNGLDPDDIHFRDTVNYANVSFRRPTRWFIRLFWDSRRKNVVTLVPVDDARALAEGLEVGEAPATFGVSRVFLDEIEQVARLEQLILKSLELVRPREE